MEASNGSIFEALQLNVSVCAKETRTPHSSKQLHPENLKLPIRSWVKCVRVHGFVVATRFGAKE